MPFDIKNSTKQCQSSVVGIDSDVDNSVASSIVDDDVDVAADVVQQQLSSDVVNESTPLILLPKWQVCFIPDKDGLFTIMSRIIPCLTSVSFDFLKMLLETSVVAFCPFTRIAVDGKTILEACSNWIM
jgi:hypothetical protein